MIMMIIMMMTSKSPLVSLISAPLSTIFISIIIINLTHLSFGHQLQATNKASHVDNLAPGGLASEPSAAVGLDPSGILGEDSATGAIGTTNRQDHSDLLQSSKHQSAPGSAGSSDQRRHPRALGDELSSGLGHRLADVDDKQASMDVGNALELLFKKKPFSKYWSVEQKWEDLFRRFIAVQGAFRQMMLKNILKDIEYYADISISPQCGKDLKFIQNYVSRSKNMRWLTHMLDSTGKTEAGMLTGNLAHLGHPVQCSRVRAPSRPSNETFDERFFEQQTQVLGERFRGKYCLASIRPVMPPRPRLVSRFERVLNASMLSNISYTGEPVEMLKRRSRQFGLPGQSVLDSIDRNHVRLDQIPFESELYQYLIEQRNFMFSLPRFLGVCYPSSCSRDDVRASLQKSFDDQHQVVDIEFECEQEMDENSWSWYTTPRLVAYIVLFLCVGTTFGASLARHILVDKMQIKRSQLKTTDRLYNLLGVLEMISLDKCVGILFIKTQRATPFTDWTKVENNRSTSIDALKGFLMLVLLYSQLVLLGCLPVGFMWSKWADAMFPFFRAPGTQLFLNVLVWSEAFYMISAYLIGLKFLENCRPKVGNQANSSKTVSPPNLYSFVVKRYIRLLMPMLAFILMNYVWPRLSNGFVMQDQANKLLKPCDNFGWTNVLMFHNYYGLNETCLWPSHVGASFFQLHLISYPILLIFLESLRANLNTAYEKQQFQFKNKLIKGSLAIVLILLISFGIVYPAFVAKNQGLIVPFLIDYLDFDNYQRVIELMLLPTYNHLTSYLVGLTLAYLVVKKRADLELAQVSSNDCLGYYLHREGSFDSIRSSSTQNLQGAGYPSKHPIDVGSGGKLNLFMPTIYVSNTGDDLQQAPMKSADRLGWICDTIKTSLGLLLLLLALVSSWYWNGLGQPISGEQTFWYLCLSRLVFSFTFAYLFYRHFAIRKNSTSPWMITRFLVPIGRMSSMVFYVGWLVIWFDLLSSPYQWHPSHYFIGEKFNEIAFATLVLSLFAYGTFEGTIKRIQYITRSDRVKASINTNLPDQLASIDCNVSWNIQQSQPKVKSFEHFFHPSEENKRFHTGGTEMSNKLPQPIGGQLVDSPEKHFVVTDSQQLSATGHGPTVVVSSSSGGQQVGSNMGPTGDTLSAASKGRRLSAADQYKLNAELRANYSFASIGLYESAGATGDLS